MAAPQPTARATRSERTQGRILEAAGRCFAASGYSKTTVEEIAAGAGVSKALVYHHFDGKEDVLQAVLERTLDEWHEVSGIDQLPDGGSVLAGIERVHRSTVEYAQQQPLLRALFKLDMLVLIGSDNRAVRDSMERVRESLQQAIERGVETGEIRSDLDPSRINDVVRILHMALVDLILNPEWIDGVDGPLVETSLEVLFRGIAGEGAR
jgi:AcrR family transcriptional regulator